MKKAEIFLAVLLLLMMLYLFVSGSEMTVPSAENVEALKKIESIGHEIMALEEDMFHQQMRQAVILEEVRKDNNEP